jgi:hypothetical protein
LDAKLRIAFKQILRLRGVYTGPNHSQIYRQLADLKDLDSPPEWPEEERREQEFVATSRFNEAGQEREAQKQIRRDQANARLAALRATANDRAQVSQFDQNVPAIGLQSQHPTAINRRAAFGPVVSTTLMFHSPPSASRQAQIQQSIETPFRSSNEPLIGYSAVNHPN